MTVLADRVPVRGGASERFLQRVGVVPRPRMAEIDAALRRHLAL